MEDIYYYCINNHFTMDFHVHDDIEINYAKNGDLEYLIGDECIKMKKGDLIVINCLIPHKLTIDKKNASIYGLEIKRRLFYDIFKSEPSDDFQVIHNAFFLGGIVQDAVISSFNNAGEDYQENCIKYLINNIAKSMGNSLVYQIKNYIITNSAEICNIKSIADHFHISSVHLQRTFKNNTQETIGGFISKIKMQHAAYLLKNRNLPVGDIYLHIGVGSRQTFYNLFKKQFGLSPSQYRKKRFTDIHGPI